MLTLEKTDLINVPESPELPGLTFRGFQGESDFPKMSAVIHGCKITDQLERAETPEVIAHFYAHLVNSDPYQDMLFAEMEHQVIGYSRVSWREELDGRRVYSHFGFLLPTWRRKGIGRAMLRYNQRRIRQIAFDHPNNAPRYFESPAADTEISATALLLSEGYTSVRHEYLMVRSDLENIPEAPLPPRLEVRPVEMDHLPVIHAASLEAFQDHWGFSEHTEPSVEQMVEDPKFDPTLWRVAWDGDQVAGMVLSFIDIQENAEYNRKRGYTENICVRRPWRRRGLARALLVMSLHAVKERGMIEAALGVDTQNELGALHLYESVGFHPVKRSSIYQKEF